MIGLDHGAYDSLPNKRPVPKIKIRVGPRSKLRHIARWKGICSRAPAHSRDCVLATGTPRESQTIVTTTLTQALHESSKS